MKKRILQAVAASALAAAAGAFIYVHAGDPRAGDVCLRPLHAETFYRIHLENGKNTDVCCPRCGLRFQEGRNDVVGVDATDFYTKERVDAVTAYYVESSPVDFCSGAAVQLDRDGFQYQMAWDLCLPSVIGFASQEKAERFQREYGGSVKTYDELRAEHS